jgi:hypothetical protein
VQRAFVLLVVDVWMSLTSSRHVFLSESFSSSLVALVLLVHLVFPPGARRHVEQRDAERSGIGASLDKQRQRVDIDIAHQRGARPRRRSVS